MEQTTALEEETCNEIPSESYDDEEHNSQKTPEEYTPVMKTPENPEITPIARRPHKYTWWELYFTS